MMNAMELEGMLDATGALVQELDAKFLNPSNSDVAHIQGVPATSNCEVR